MDIESLARALNIQGGYLATIPHADVRPSPIHGRGLFTTSPLDPGAVLCTLDGQHVRLADAPGVMDAFEWNAVSKAVLLVRTIRTSYGFMNHSRQPNVRIDPNTMQMRAIAPIPAATELLIDYLDQPLPDAYLQRPQSAFLDA